MCCLVLRGGFIGAPTVLLAGVGQSEGVVGGLCQAACCISPSRPWFSSQPHSSPLPAPSLEAAEFSTVTSHGGEMSWRNLGCSCLVQRVSKLNMNLSHWKAIFFQDAVIRGTSPNLQAHQSCWGIWSQQGRELGAQTRALSHAAGAEPPALPFEIVPAPLSPPDPALLPAPRTHFVPNRLFSAWDSPACSPRHRAGVWHMVL